ncbi:MAG TPA: hypothetical protein VNS88_12955 [Nitrospiraceae bacterium]|nr:hypothetical protein [Nitrospiraceae bacterium]
MADAFRNPVMRAQRDAVLTELNRRMDKLRPIMLEVKHLEDMLKLIEAAQGMKKEPSIPWDQIIDWFKNNVAPTDVVKTRDLEIAFDRGYGWADARMKKLLEEGYLEPFGNGLLRRPAVNEGRHAIIRPGQNTLIQPAKG